MYFCFRKTEGAGRRGIGYTLQCRARRDSTSLILGLVSRGDGANEYATRNGHPPIQAPRSWRKNISVITCIKTDLFTAPPILSNAQAPKKKLPVSFARATCHQ